MSVELASVQCPSCGERYDTPVDLSAGDQCYVEDCAICCRPLVLTLRVDENGALAAVEVRREEE